MTSIDSKQVAAEGAGRHSPHATRTTRSFPASTAGPSLAGRALTAAQVLALQRTAGGPAGLSHAQLLALQRTTGNATVARFSHGLQATTTRGRSRGGGRSGRSGRGRWPETASSHGAVRSLLRKPQRSRVIQRMMGFELELGVFVDANGRPPPEKRFLGSYGAQQLELQVDHNREVEGLTPASAADADFTVATQAGGAATEA